MDHPLKIGILLGLFYFFLIKKDKEERRQRTMVQSSFLEEEPEDDDEENQKSEDVLTTVLEEKEGYTISAMHIDFHTSLRIGINPDRHDLIILLDPSDNEPIPAVCLTEKQTAHLIHCLQTCLRDLSQMEPPIGCD